MNWRVLIALFVFCQSAALADSTRSTQRDPKLSNQEENAAESSRTPYTVMDQPGIMLFDNATDARKKLGYLLIDNNGKPAIYVHPRSLTIAGPKESSLLALSHIKALWVPTEVGPGVYSRRFVGWQGTKWVTFEISLSFEGDDCKGFRVTGPGIKATGWLSSDDIPKGWTTSSHREPLPVEIGCIEGPKETSDSQPSF